MKQYSLFTLMILLGTLIFNSCVDESMGDGEKKVVEGIPVGIKLSFVKEDAEKISTKVGIGEDAENSVYDICIFVFDKDKRYEYSQYLETSSSDKPLTVTETTFPVGSITSGTKYIYAIANLKGELSGIGDEINWAEESQRKGRVANVNDLNSLTNTLQTNTVQRLGGRLLMSGSFVLKNGDTGDGRCPIDVKNSGDIVSLDAIGVIKLKHLDSRIKFDVSIGKVDTISFTPKSWKVINVPAKSFVMSQTSDVPTTNSDYFNTEEATFDAGGIFTFYMQENRKEPINLGISTYSDREKQNKKADKTNGDYIYADPNATYVEITGSYIGYTDASKQKVRTTAEVKYTIHLGYVNTNNLSKSQSGDFKSERNKSYTYKVTVKGVEDIVLEVVTDNERQPGAEGDVVRADQNLVLDSHYETRTVTFYKKSLTNLSAKVNTPFDDKGELYVNGTSYENTLNDYKWVKFVRNKKIKGKYPESSYATYVGDEKYCKTNANSVLSGEDDQSQYLFIDQLLCKLNQNRENLENDFWDEDGKVVYTVFVDNFYYDANPVLNGKNITWKDFVNKPNRKMYILCDTKWSTDKESSLTTSNILIDQRSIKTIYDIDEGPATAWGIETINENDRLKWGGTINDVSLSKTNGRYNTVFQIQLLSKNNSWQSKKWSDFVDKATNKLKSDVKIEYAFLLRNRDLDGDDIIDPDEVQWYIPAINQYSGLWIGKDGLEPDVRLFQDNPETVTTANRDKYHFVSSDGVRFWAEEGASTGGNLTNMKNENFDVRCARNLGGFDKRQPVMDKEPVDYVQKTTGWYSVSNVSGNQEWVSSIDLSYLNVKARRQYLQTDPLTESGEHNGADLNRPYKKFKVSSLKNSCSGWIDGESGWRYPNQRELSLIAGYSPGQLTKTGAYGLGISSCTFSDLGFKSNKYFTAFWNGSLNVVSLDYGKSSNVRCVKDID